MLPLSDRVLLRLRSRKMAARLLAQELGVDVSDVHRVLRGLEVAAIVERVPNCRPAVWRLAPGVRVELQPATVVVTGVRLPAPEERGPEVSPRCRAITTRGRPCPRTAWSGGLCFLDSARWRRQGGGEGATGAGDA